MSNFKDELDFAFRMAKNAGEIMQKYFDSPEQSTTWKENHTPITVADQEINDMLISQVQNTFPNHGVIGEEGSFEEERDMVWVVDPIDGTSPYTLGIPTSTFCLALVDRYDGQPVLSVVYDPFLDQLFRAEKGIGAFMNNKPIKTSDAETLHHGYLAVNGFSKKLLDGKVVMRPGRLIERIRQVNNGKCLTFQSHVYTAVRVANGHMLGAILAFGSPWDAAAASLIVQEAGGVAVDLEGKIRRYDQFDNGTVVAANEKIADILIKEIKISCEDK